MRLILFLFSFLIITLPAFSHEAYLELKTGKRFFVKIIKREKQQIFYRYRNKLQQASLDKFSIESQRRIKEYFGSKKSAVVYTNKGKVYKGLILSFDHHIIQMKLGKKKLKIKRSDLKEIRFSNGHIYQITPTKTKADFTAKVELVFYSSIEEEMYVIGDFNDWKDGQTKMLKEGHRFSAIVTVKNASRYKFVSHRSYTCHYNIDPLNALEDEGTASITLQSNKPTTNENPLVQYVYSKHFDYFTLYKPKQIFEMERVYKALTTKVLAFFSNHLQASRGKMRSYASFKQGAFAIHGSSEICDSGDCVNTHEMIHGLLGTPRFGAFAEGFAQCFQLSGNAEYFPVKKEYNFDTNPTISIQHKLKNNKDIDIKYVMANFSGYLYHEMASFIYWSTHVDRANLDKFVAWARDLNHDQKHACESYKKIYGYDLSVANKQWNKWARKVSPRQCDVDWHYGEYLKDNEGLPAAKDAALYSRGRLVTNKYLKAKRTYLNPDNAYSAQSGWSYPRKDRSIDGKTLRANNKKYQQGIGVHANSKIVYLLDDSFKEFNAECAVDDETVGGKDIGASVVFRVLFDDKEVFNSGVMRYKQQAKKIRLALKGCKKITLEVGDAGDGGHSDHADWLNIFLR